MNNQEKTIYMAKLSLLSAIIVVMSVVPFLGYIPLGFMNATVIHVPVIIGGILMGPKAGGILGAVFGITSLIKNTVQPNITSFVFTPFFTIGEGGGNPMSLVICLVPRILIGVVAGYVFILIAKKENRKLVACCISGVLGSLTNTILVMAGIFLFFGESYAAAKDMAYENLFMFIAGIIGTVGVGEAIVAAILSALVASPLIRVFSKKSSVK